MILTVTANPAVDIVYFVDKFEMGEVSRPLNMTCTAGGKGLNVARVASILGIKTAAMGFVGGYNGEFIGSEIEKLGIKNLFNQITGETRKCINISDASGKSGEILEAGPSITAYEKENFLKSYTEEIEKYGIVWGSGRLPKGLDSEFYCELVEIARKNNKKCIVDTSGQTLEAIIGAKPYMIKPNQSEASKLFGYDIRTNQDVKKALKELYDRGIELPVISLGKEGAMAYIEHTFFTFNIPEVSVVNTVGSGDSTIAGIAVGLSHRMSICDAVKLGMAAGIANTQYKQTGMVSQELTERFYKQISVLES